MYSRTRTFDTEVHKWHIWDTICHKKYKMLNCVERHSFCSNDLLTKSNRTTLQSYKVEERTFGTPCTAKRAAVRKIQNLVIKELRIFLPERNLQRVRNFNKEEWYIDKFHSKTNRIWYSYGFWRKRMSKYNPKHFISIRSGFYTLPTTCCMSSFTVFFSL